MNDREYRRQKRRVERVFDRWRAPLGLGWWRVGLVWSRERDRVRPDTDVAANGVEVTAARTTVSWPYREATIEFFLPALEDVSDERLEYIVVHECMHILVNEMRWVDGGADNIEHEERVVTDLAKAFRWVRDAAEKRELPLKRAKGERDA